MDTLILLWFGFCIGALLVDGLCYLLWRRMPVLERIHKLLN